MRIFILVLSILQLCILVVWSEPYLYPKLIDINTTCSPDNTLISNFKKEYQPYVDCPESKQEILAIDLNGDSRCEYLVTEDWGRRCEAVTKIFSHSGKFIPGFSGHPSSIRYATKKNGFVRILHSTWGGHRTNMIIKTNVYAFDGEKYICEFCTNNSHGGYLDIAKTAYDNKNYRLAEIYFLNAYRMLFERRLSDANNVAMVFIKQGRFNDAIDLLSSHLLQTDNDISASESSRYAYNYTISKAKLERIKSSAYYNRGLANEKKGLLNSAFQDYKKANKLRPSTAVKNAIGRVVKLKKPEQRFWEKFPTPPARATGISALGLDRRGDLWVMAGQGTYTWDAQEKKWSNPILGAGQYLTGLHGGIKNQLYATQRGNKDHWGEIYSLERGRATYVTDFYYEVAHNRPGFYVSKDGRFINWGGNTLRVFAGGEWTEYPADLHQTGPLLFDGGNTVSLLFKNHLYTINRRNRITETEVDVLGGRGALLGDDKAVVLKYGGRGVTILDLRSGDIVDSVNGALTLGQRSVYDLFSSSNGDVWIMAHDPGLSNYVLFRMKPDGTINMVPDTAGIPWDNQQFLQSPQSVVTDRYGTMWFASFRIGVFTLKDGKIKQFDHRLDNSPGPCGVLLEGRRGIIYAGTGHGLYCYNNGTPLTDKVPPVPPAPVLPGKSSWKHVPLNSGEIRMAWLEHGLVLFVMRRGRTLVALDAQSGEVRFSIPISIDDAEQAWVSSGHESEIVVSLNDRILAIDTVTGVILRTMHSKRDGRIEPVAVGHDYVLSEQYRGSLISRVSLNDNNAWDCKLSGYLMTHTSLFGSTLLAQTRQGMSYGININTGKQLWSDLVDAYGAGFAFADDARYCVETGRFLAPKTTEARIIARNPLTGRRLWQYQKSGTTVSHAPLIDVEADLIYSVLQDGTVVCLQGQHGDLVWETQLPRPPRSAPAASYDPYHSCMTFSAGLLGISSDDHVLYLLDARDGRILRRIAVAKDHFRHGKRTGTSSIVAGPWLLHELLIIPSDTEISAHNIADYQSLRNRSK